MGQASRDEKLLTEEHFLVLNAIYLRKMAAPQHIEDVTGLPPDRVRDALDVSLANGSVIDLGGQLMLGDAGRDNVVAFYRERYADVRTSDALRNWYERFETANAAFIKGVTDWQKSDGDERVQERLVRLVERHVGSLRDLYSSVPRYERYAARFERGLAKIDGGDRDFVCKPTLDSVHNVWFEFHEDILAVLGRPRET